MTSKNKLRLENNRAYKTDYDIPKISYISAVLFIFISFLYITIFRKFISNKYFILFLLPAFISTTTFLLESKINKTRNKFRKVTIIKILLYFVIIFLYLLIILF